jgi:hypothetical protein
MNTKALSSSFQSVSISEKSKWLIASVLMLLLIVTRSHLTEHLSDASWAIFFVVGFYLSGSTLGRLGFPLFFLAAFIIDLVVIDAQGGVHYCFTPSYPFLIPAYAAMWFAGRWFAKHYQENMRGLSYFIASATVGVAACFLISNAGFYFFAGKFEEMSMLQYTNSVLHYLPAYMKTTAIFLSATALVHLVITRSKKLGEYRAHS